MIKISKNLTELVKILNTDVYLVGGYVRNSLLHLPVDDIDIASKLQVEQIFDMLSGTKYLVKIKSAKMGTVEIFVGSEVYQHTTFRSDSYNCGGGHCPSSTSFTTSLKEDAKRRDFTINAIYYNIKSRQFYDFYNGINDLKSKTLKCIETAENVFSVDGLRLLRLVRFASKLNFEIDSETYEFAKTYAKNLKNISGERKQKEICAILEDNDSYKNADAINGIKLLFDLNLIKYIFAFDKEFLSFDIYDFSAVKNASNLNKIYALLLCFYVKMKESVEIKNFVQIVANKNALNFSNNQTKLLNKLVKAFSKLDAIKNMQMFIYNNYIIIDILLELLLAFNYNNLYEELNATLNQMKELHTPFTLKELKVNGNDLIKQYNLKGSEISYVLNACHKMCINNPKLNEKQILIEKAKNFIKKC